MESTPHRKTALITGASSGIGLELARVLAAEGHDLVLVARSGERLRAVAEELASLYRVHIDIEPCDLADPDAPTHLFDSLQARSRRIDILVNNAGFGTWGPFVETDLNAELEELQVNVAAVLHLTKLFLREMVSRGSGRVMNVASTAAFQSGPLMAVYYATKAFVLSFTGAIEEELRGTGVTATVLCPGPTRTEFQKRAGVGSTNLFRRFLLMDAPAVAEAGYKGMMNGRRIVIPGFLNRLVPLVGRVLPHRLLVRIVHRLHTSRPDLPR